MVGSPGWIPYQQLGLALAVAAAATAVWWLDRPRGRWSAALRRRLLLGVPWGTVTMISLVLAVYLFFQGGLEHWYAPVTLPFRAWSYFSPLGVALASFAHVGPGHLIGNLIGTLAFGSLAEYAVGHFPRDRGASSFSSVRTNPYVRAFVAVPAVAILAGLLTAVFAIGPVIGFSAVVFAFAGVALVYYPYRTVLAVFAARALRISYNALLYPRTVAEARPVFSTPWWSEIAIQGHALGLFVGVAFGAWLARRRGHGRPAALRLWTGALLFGVAESLWAVYWFRGNGTFVLYRAVGLALVVVLATLVAATVTASDRPLLPARVREAATAASGSTARPASGSPPRWKAGLVTLVLIAAVLSGPAVPYNLVTVGDDELPAETVTVRGYEVTYAEDVPNGLTSAFEIDAFGETTAVNASGVIVRNPDRNIWTPAVQKGRLAFEGRTVVRVGGLTWRDRVVAVREGWRTATDEVTYRVSLRHGGETVPVFAAPPTDADVVLDGRSVSVVAEPSRFLLRVQRGNVTAEAPLPGRNESVTVDGVRFVREGETVYAERDDTRVRVATEERYGEERRLR